MATTLRVGSTLSRQEQPDGVGDRLEAQGQLGQWFSVRVGVGRRTHPPVAAGSLSERLNGDGAAALDVDGRVSQVRAAEEPAEEGE